MAGSQLKQLKEKLKSAGLTGQTNVKKKGKTSKRAPNETRRQDKEEVLKAIREQFNPFDVHVNRNKRADAVAKKITVGKPGISKQIGEEQRRVAYEAKKQKKNKVGGIRDRRFGESDKNLTAEEKMLERFTRERQAQAAKTSMYNLDDDDDEFSGGITSLTHMGKSLGFGGDDDDDDISGDEDDDFFSQKRSATTSFEEDVDSTAPQRKKTKAEVMKEVIAKSKFYKHERQRQNEMTENQVLQLDEEFADIMSDIRSVKQPKSTGIVPKSQADIEYDTKVRELALDKRAVPADRTKTAEELEKEKKEHMAKLEADRLRRMEGYLDEENKDTGADDLDDDFWDAGSDNEEDGFKIRDSEDEAEFNNDDSEAEEEEGDEQRSEVKGRNRLLREQSSGKPTTITINGKVIQISSSKAITSLPCPSSLAEFQEVIEGNEYPQIKVIINKIFNTYQPKLADGNKEKCGIFATVLLEYVLYLSDKEFAESEKEEYTKLIEFLSVVIKDLSEKYPETMCGAFRTQIQTIQNRIVTRANGDFQGLVKKSDLIFFTIIGRTFSTSDLYHLVVTPSIILICEILEILQIEKFETHLFSGIYLIDLLLQYQRISKRLVPETIQFLERVLLTLMQEPEKFQNVNDLSTRRTPLKKTKFTLKSNTELPENVSNLSFSRWDQHDEPLLSNCLLKSLHILDNYTSLIFKEKSSFLEIAKPFAAICKHLVIYNAKAPIVSSLISKLNNLIKIATAERKPLRLQSHRAAAIPTYVPKFYDNFNPDKKSYDPDATRQEISKLRYQIKEERKSALRDIRKDSQFEARQQIKEKKKEYEEYHAKMSRIFNSIATEEGAAKNEYERERKLRKAKK